MPPRCCALGAGHLNDDGVKASYGIKREFVRTSRLGERGIVMSVPLAGFRSHKAAQVAAYFAEKSASEIDKLKLIKLVYLTEREYIAANRVPMLFDELYSLPHGPICSRTLDGINGDFERTYWSRFLSVEQNVVFSRLRYDEDAYDELSLTDIDVLESVWRRFGQMSASGIRNWSHKNLPEYTEIDRGRVQISHESLMRAVGLDCVNEIAEEIKDFRREARVLSLS